MIDVARHISKQLQAIEKNKCVEVNMQPPPSMHDPPLTQKEIDEIEKALDDLHDMLVALS